jgi:hypothetical protein
LPRFIVARKVPVGASALPASDVATSVIPVSNNSLPVIAVLVRRRVVVGPSDLLKMNFFTPEKKAPSEWTNDALPSSHFFFSKRFLSGLPCNRSGDQNQQPQRGHQHRSADRLGHKHIGIAP